MVACGLVDTVASGRRVDFVFVCPFSRAGGNSVLLVESDQLNVFDVIEDGTGVETLIYKCSMALWFPPLVVSLLPVYSGFGGSSGKYFGNVVEDGSVLSGNEAVDEDNTCSLTGGCALLILFPDYRAAVCAYDADFDTVRTLSIHSFLFLRELAAPILALMNLTTYVRVEGDLNSDVGKGSVSTPVTQLPIAFARQLAHSCVFVDDDNSVFCLMCVDPIHLLVLDLKIKKQTAYTRFDSFRKQGEDEADLPSNKGTSIFDMNSFDQIVQDRHHANSTLSHHQGLHDPLGFCASLATRAHMIETDVLEKEDLDSAGGMMVNDDSDEELTQHGDELFGDHEVFGSTVKVMNCWYISLLNDIPLPRDAENAAGAAAPPGLPEILGEAHSLGAGAGGLPYRVIDLIALQKSVRPQAAILLQTSPSELGFTSFSTGKGAGCNFVVIMSFTRQRDFQILLKIPGLLNDTFSMIALPRCVGGGLICMSPDSFTVLNVMGGISGGGAFQGDYTGGKEELAGACLNLGLRPDVRLQRLFGFSQIVNAGGLVRQDLINLCVGLIDCSSLSITLDDSLAKIIADTCCLILLKDGRAVMAHLISGEGCCVTDVHWSAVDLSVPASRPLAPQIGLESGQLPSATMAVCKVVQNQGTSPWYSTDLCNLAFARDDRPTDACEEHNTKWLVVLGGSSYSGSGVVILVSEPKCLIAQRRILRSPFGSTKDLILGISDCMDSRIQKPASKTAQIIYTADGKDMIQILPHGGVIPAAQRAKVLNYTEIESVVSTNYLSESVAMNGDTTAKGINSDPYGFFHNLTKAEMQAVLGNRSACVNGRLEEIFCKEFECSSVEIQSFQFCINDHLTGVNCCARDVTVLPDIPIERFGELAAGEGRVPEEAVRAWKDDAEGRVSAWGAQMWLSVGGVGPYSRLICNQKSVPLESVSISMPAVGCRTVWSLEDCKQGSLGEETISDFEGSQFHRFLLASTDPRVGIGCTKLYKYNATEKNKFKLVNATDTALELDMSTLGCGPLIGGQLFVQMTSEELRVLDSDLEVLGHAPIDLTAAENQFKSQLYSTVSDGGSGNETNLKESAVEKCSAVVVCGSVEDPYVAAVLDDLSVRVWRVDEDAAVEVCIRVREREGFEPSFSDVSRPLVEISNLLPFCCRRGIKHTQLFRRKRVAKCASGKMAKNNSDNVFSGTTRVSGDVTFCCMLAATNDNGRREERIHILNLETMQCVFESSNLLMVPPILRDKSCDFCLYHPADLNKMNGERKVCINDLQMEIDRPAVSSPHIDNNSERAISCIWVDPHFSTETEPAIIGETNEDLVGTKDESLKQNEASADSIVKSSNIIGCQRMGIKLYKCLDEVLSVHFVFIDPETDSGPTIVAFITGRPILIYRASQDLKKIYQGCSFPFFFTLFVHSCTDIIPSAVPSYVQCQGEEHATIRPPSANFRVAAGFVCHPVPYANSFIALVVPPCGMACLPEDGKQINKPNVPLIWLCAHRNQLFVHPNMRRDIISCAPFRTDWKTDSFVILTDSGNLIRSTIGSPSGIRRLSTASSGIGAAPLRGSKSTGSLSKFQLNSSLPFTAFPLPATATLLAVSSLASYIRVGNRLQMEGGLKNGPFITSGRLFAFSVWHHAHEVAQLMEVLTERKRIQKMHLVLQGNLSNGEDGRQTTAVTENAILSACTDSAIESVTKTGRQYEILIFHEADLQRPVGTRLLNPCEEVASLNFVTLDSMEMLAVGIVIQLGEKTECSGRALLLSIPEACIDLEEASTMTDNPVNVATYADFEMNGPVTRIGSFSSFDAERDYLLHSVGPRLFLHELEGSKLARGAFSDCGSCVTSLSTLRDLFVVGDAHQGIHLFRWEYDATADSRKLERIAGTPSMWFLPVVACGIATTGESFGMLATDVNGNARLFYYSNDENSHQFEAHELLCCNAECRVSHTPITHMCQFLTEGASIGSVATTADGMWLTFRNISKEEFDLLTELQSLLEELLPFPCGMIPAISRIPAGSSSLSQVIWAAQTESALRHEVAQIKNGPGAENWFSFRRIIEKRLCNAIRSRQFVDSRILRFLPFLSVPVTQKIMSICRSENIWSNRINEDDNALKPDDDVQNAYQGSALKNKRGQMATSTGLLNYLAARALRGLDVPLVPGDILNKSPV